MLNRAVTNLYDEALRPYEAKVSQMNILVAAACLKVARPAAICEVLELDESTVSRNVERMKARGWLENVADEDARAQPFRLTAAGRRLLARATPAWQQAQVAAEDLLGTELCDQLGQAAARLRAKAR
jgi:DNA-binding MarR family transcriptional regulator